MTTLLERVKMIGGNGGEAGFDEPTIPMDLPELAEGFDRDPEPAPATRKPVKEPKSAASSRTAAKQPRTGGKFVSTTAQVKTAAEEIEVMLKLLAFTWSLTDEDCADTLNETSTRISADMAKLVSRSPWLMEHVSTGGLLGDILKLSISLKPLAQKVWAHHGPAARRARIEQEENGYDAVTVAEPTVQPDRYAPFRPNIAVA